MRSKWLGWATGGCMTFLAGVMIGSSLTVLALVGWALVRPVDLSPLDNRIVPGGSDLEVTISEAYLNQTVADELAERELEGLARIVVDVQRGGRLEATLQGNFTLGGALPPAPIVSTEVRLGVANGRVDVRIERVAIGPVLVDRDTLPGFALPLFESTEETMELAIAERILAEGLEVREVRSDDGTLTLGLGQR